mmetsp:Transcript_18566/g.28186  ORF Transcript_18566/g.28186 Transcript_18566/m.28186 type:complete len:492 (+) Transcript_18566:75-1550(+)|eukprot:CAMPEP_0194254286 /NCGR_PEP_ID=MMETSP0158-20130606/31767_1 /TAXON_ID=33649 /ORGANISM="Thalassionema nitzschioides, Strain L26-B" /LENGTH=491 /DNA_ID=CAMNT_0038992257 /DNA_START=61 /DNA_END=1536 /DNA_ORIENTATION=+
MIKLFFFLVPFLIILFSQEIRGVLFTLDDPASLDLRPVLRLKERPTPAEFEEIYAPEEYAIPIVLEHKPDVDAFDPSLFTRSALREVCGDFPLVEENVEECYSSEEEKRKSSQCHSVKYRDTKKNDQIWAGLQYADPVGENITTFGDLLEAQDNTNSTTTSEGFSNWYLHDAPLSEVCPPLVSKLFVPPYFTRDYSLIQFVEFSPESIKRGTIFPSIFVSKKGTGSGLHADGGRSRFWTRQLSGRKLWRISPPSQYDKLYPTKKRFHSPTIFQASIIEPDFVAHPKLDKAIVYETILEPGDILFVPGGWAHEVRNLEDAIMIGQNYHDDHVLQQRKLYSESWRKVYEDVGLDNALMPIGPALLDDSTNKNETTNGMDYASFYRAQCLPHAPVPSHLRQWFEREGRESLEAYRDPKTGLGLLQLATYYHYVAVVKYLIDEVGMDVNELDHDTGSTALDISETQKGRTKLEKFLKERGGMRGSEIKKQISQEL